jgi:hypothetical protein
LFRVKGPIVTKGNPNKKPNAPTVTLAATSMSRSQFGAADAGNLTYQVFAINKYGISEPATPAPIGVASGDVVILSITHDASKPGTGYIICRSMPGQPVTMEMVRIGRDKENPVTEYTDFNDDLPGTTEMIFITEKKIQTVAEFYQLLPLRLYRMNPVNRLVTPFILALWGVLDLKNPEWCGLAKNIAYDGGFYG